MLYLTSHWSKPYSHRYWFIQKPFDGIMHACSLELSCTPPQPTVQGWLVWNMPSEGFGCKTLAKVLKGSQAFPLLLFISFCPLTHCKQICSGNVSFLLTGYCFIILFFTKNNLISMWKKTFSQGLPSWHLQCNGNAPRDRRPPPPGWLLSVQAAIIIIILSQHQFPT